MEKLDDPGTNINILKMDIIQNLEITEGRVSFNLVPTSSICPLVFKLAFNIKEAIENISGVKKVDITVINHKDAEQLNKLLEKSKI